MTLGLGDVDFGYICAGCHAFIQYGQCHECEGFDEGSAPPYPRLFDSDFIMSEAVEEIDRKLDKILDKLEEKQ